MVAIGALRTTNCALSNVFWYSHTVDNLSIVQLGQHIKHQSKDRNLFRRMTVPERVKQNVPVRLTFSIFSLSIKHSTCQMFVIFIVTYLIISLQEST